MSRPGQDVPTKTVSRRYPTKYMVGILLVSMILGYVLFQNRDKRKEHFHKEDGPIKIALISINQEGLKHYGNMFVYGSQLMLDQINGNGGIHGKPVELVVFDDPCEEKVSDISEKIRLSPEIMVVIGPMCSLSASALAPIFEKLSLPSIMPTVTSSFISRANNRWVFRNIYSDDFQSKSLAVYAKTVLKLDKVAILYEETPFGVCMRDAFVEKAKELYLEVVASEPYPLGTTDFKRPLEILEKKGATAIFLGGHHEEGAIIAQQAKMIGFHVRFLAPDTMAHPGLIEIGGEAVEGFLVCKPFLWDLGDEKVRRFIEAFVDRFYEMPTWIAVNAYDAVGVATAAMREVGYDRRAIRDYLAEMCNPQKAYDGISGPIYFDETGNCIRPIYIASVKGGKFVAARGQLSGNLK